MNRILDRYLARQILLGTGAAVVVLTLVFGLGNIFKRALPQLVDNTLSLERFGLFILYILPFAVAYTVPWGFLSAILLTFGRLSADHELISIRMAGRSMWRICLPVFLIATLLSGLCFWLNLNVSPRAKWEMKSIVKDILSDDPSIIFREKEILDDMVIHVEPAEDGWSGRKIRLVKVDSMNRPVLWAFADRVELKRHDDQLTAELLDVEMEYRESEEDAQDRPRPAAMAYPFDPDRVTPASSDNFPLEIKLPSNRPKANEMTRRELHTALSDAALPDDDAAAYQTEMTKRYSMSLACLAFCMIGIPLGVTAQRRETSIGFALSLAVAVIYFLFIFLGETFGEEASALPHVLMWTPSALFIGLGGFLFYRLNKR